MTRTEPRMGYDEAVYEKDGAGKRTRDGRVEKKRNTKINKTPNKIITVNHTKSNG